MMEAQGAEEDVEYLDAGDSDDERPISRLSNASSVSSVSEVPTAGTSAGVDPWPYLKNYFEFVSRDGDKVQYNCVLCLPKRQKLNVHTSTRNGLKVHVRSTHPHKLSVFEDLLALKSGRKQKQRKE
jgi:hypothetical protein